MIRFKPSNAADVPNPPAGYVTLFVDDATGQPSTISEGGAVVSLKGAHGADGADGSAGANGDGQYPTVSFAFGDASPAIVMTVNPASAAEVALVQVEIEEAFDGVGAQIAFGTVADPDSLMRADQNDPSELAVYETSPRVRLAGGEQLQLTITPGAGASQGRGKIILQATPTA